MATVERSIEVDVPVGTAYKVWTNFEELPRFMEGVDEVRRLGGNRLHWVGNIEGQKEEWDAVITDEVPNQKVAWRSTSGAQNAGTVTFQPLNNESTLVTVKLEYTSTGALEKVGNAMGYMDHQLQGDLARFKAYIEQYYTPTGKEREVESRWLKVD